MTVAAVPVLRGSALVRWFPVLFMAVSATPLVGQQPRLSTALDTLLVTVGDRLQLTVRVEHDRAICGLFARDEWLATLADVGFVGAAVLPFEHSEVEPGAHEMFLATR